MANFRGEFFAFISIKKKKKFFFSYHPESCVLIAFFPPPGLEKIKKGPQLKKIKKESFGRGAFRGGKKQAF